MMYKAVAFDGDGTIFDSLHTYHKFLKQLCKERGKDYIIRNGKEAYEIRNPEDLRPFFKEPWEEIYNLLGFDWNKDRAWIRRAHLTYMCKSVPSIILGMEEILRDLVERKVPLGLVTSSEPKVTEINLRATGLYNIFSYVAAHDGTRKRKPAPDYLHLCFDKLGVAPDTSVYVGDQPSDIQAAKAAKTKSIGVTWGFSDYKTLLKEEPTDIARNPRMLEAILSS